MLPKVKLFKTKVSVGEYQDYLSAITSLGLSKQSSYVCFANVHMLMEAYDHPEINQAVNSADIVSPDGRPISVLIKKNYGIQQGRACGMDLFPDILNSAEKNQLSVFFYGSTQEVLEKIEEKINLDYPKLKIAGSFSPPFRQLSPSEEEDVISLINDSGANLIFVSLGCPKQEMWMYRHKGKIHGCMMGLGQAFLTFTGMEKRLPVWARNLSLEWAYRLYLEPKRLWKRYLYGNSKFMFLSLKAYLIK
ncbi:WecB/TagA/CpsF family glycosyltransferase [Pararhodonellum marinum]|uniref:WecB/TagA/CpsF family glycosyltransferase n=1 Tax=Pararhodonellum marinum TaxID=2755358 RepID=UPI00188FA1F2|nr:WecB/TagA/CpsF family glycosyltransferase [Pararhodonellum marinum]